MMFLFDTDTLSQIMKRNPSPSLLARMHGTPPNEQFTSAITLGEIVFGAQRSSRREYLMSQLEELLWPNLNVLPFDQAAAMTYGRIRAELELAGTPLAEADLRIGAIALDRDLTVITGNTRHFSRIPGLKLDNWL
jgi:predicted nucleic acid-binding protein